MAEEFENILKKGIVGVSLKQKQVIFCTLYVTDTNLILKDQNGTVQEIEYTHIHDILSDKGSLAIRCIYPRPFFGSEEEYIRITIVRLEKSEDGNLKIVLSQKWSDSWKRYLSQILEAYLDNLDLKKKGEGNDLFFSERIERSDKGLGTCENVKRHEKMLITCPHGLSKIFKVYITNTRILIKLKSHDYLIVPFSVIHTIFYNKRGARLNISFSCAQRIEHIQSEIHEISFQRIPVDGEKYVHVHNTRWVEEWEWFFTELFSQFSQEKDVFGRKEMVTLLSEIRYSPARYNLPVHTQRGWDSACASASEQLRRIETPDRYQYLNYLIDEYEDWQLRACAETDELQQKACTGSVLALSSILTYFAKKAILKE